MVVTCNYDQAWHDIKLEVCQWSYFQSDFILPVWKNLDFALKIMRNHSWRVLIRNFNVRNIFLAAKEVTLCAVRKSEWAKREIIAPERNRAEFTGIEKYNHHGWRGWREREL